MSHVLRFLSLLLQQLTLVLPELLLEVYIGLLLTLEL